MIVPSYGTSLLLKRLCVGEDGFKYPTLVPLLFLLAILLRLTMPRVECRHASLRSLLMCKGMTSKSDIANLVAEWILQRQRLIQAYAKKFQNAMRTSDDRFEWRDAGEDQQRTRVAGALGSFMSDSLFGEEAED